jgi:hypothetical protein
MSLAAQQQVIYSIHLGKYENATTQDNFSKIQSLGYIYALPSKTKNAWDVSIGDYESQEAATTVLNFIEKNGYEDAFIEKKFANAGKMVYVVQIAVFPFEAIIGWGKLVKSGFLTTTVEKKQVKVLSGMYDDLATAQKRAKTIKEMGFEDAFVRKVNESSLHEVTLFETGNLPNPAVIILDGAPTNPPTVPSSYENTETSDDLTPKSAEKDGLNPNKYEKIKRVSVLDVQSILKINKLYDGSIDGLYGKGTQIALEKFIETSAEWSKYGQMATTDSKKSKATPQSALQKAVYTLLDDTPAALKAFSKTEHPIAKAYQAYLLYVSKERIADVNNLMNTAIKVAYKEYKEEPPFDYTANYTYNSLKQLILHIWYVHQATRVPFPNWMFTRHEELVKELVTEGKMKYTRDVPIEINDVFLDVPSMGVLSTMANEFSIHPKDIRKSPIYLAEQQKRIALFYLPKSIDEKSAKALQTWHRGILADVVRWSDKDALRKKNQKAFQMAYLKAQIIAENFYMDKGFSLEESQTLALAVLQTLIPAWSKVL